MALELKLRNFTNLVIFERNNRVGGMSYDYHYKGLDDPKRQALWRWRTDNFNSLELTEYIGRGPASLLLSYIEAIRYVNLHKELFGTYRGELMPRPSSAVLYRIRGTFFQFLKREKLLCLVPFFKLSQTVQGFGDEISAFYGLMWNTPRLMAVHVVKSGRHNLFVLRQGYQRVWERLQEVERFRIVFNTRLVRITRVGE